MMFRRWSLTLFSPIADPLETDSFRLAISDLLLRSFQEFHIATAVSTVRSLYIFRPQREQDLQNMDMRTIAFRHWPLRGYPHRPAAVVTQMPTFAADINPFRYILIERLPPFQPIELSIKRKHVCRNKHA